MVFDSEPQFIVHPTKPAGQAEKHRLCPPEIPGVSVGGIMVLVLHAGTSDNTREEIM